jgi:hypothetical protein
MPPFSVPTTHKKTDATSIRQSSSESFFKTYRGEDGGEGRGGGDQGAEEGRGGWEKRETSMQVMRVCC